MLEKVTEVTEIDFGKIGTLVLAGGGNRCWWQAGALQHLLEHDVHLPANWIGTSAGAAIAASFLVEHTESARDACLRLFASNPNIFDWSGLSKLKLNFAHEHVYPAWIDAFLNSSTFAALRSSPSRLTVALTRPARWLGLGGSIIAGTLAYLVDRYLWNSIHPRLPGMLGLRQDFVVLNDCTDIHVAQATLIAAASAPPFMAARVVDGKNAMDGGYTDNAPIPTQSNEERSNTLVMLTRHYPKFPSVFHWLGRTYWQPSQRIPVSTWDCTPRATVMQAWDLGRQDSARALRSGLIR
jgi:predicted acylesterase/phospholipase RssA